MNIMARALQRGVTLIEVLVSVLVLAVGLLGLAALLGNAMQSNQHAQARTQAVFLAGDMMERMRANRTNRAAYALDEMGDPGACDANWRPLEEDAAGGLVSVATNDIREWQNSLRCYLPDGNGSVAVTDDGAGNFIISVRVSWVAVDMDEIDGEQTRERITIVSEL